METTKTEQILLQEGITIEELINIAHDEISKLYYNYPRIQAEHDISDLIQNTMLYFLQLRKDGKQRFEYYAADGKKHFLNLFKMSCKQAITELPRYNYMKYKALSLNTPMKDDTETEYIDSIPDSTTTDFSSLQESLEQIYELLNKRNKHKYLYLKKQENPTLTDLEIILDVNTQIALYKKLHIEQTIIKLLHEGYPMHEIKKLLDYPEFQEDVSLIKETFTEYYQLDKPHTL